MYWGKIMHNIFLFILDSFPFFCYACYTLSRVNWICLFQRLCYQKLFSIIVRSDVTTYICCMGIFRSDIEKTENE